MKIIRNGVEFNLTKEELIEAYFEQQYEFDKGDVIGRLEEMDDEAEREKLTANVENIAEDMRRNIDKYGMDWTYALDEAIKNASLDDQ